MKRTFALHHAIAEHATEGLAEYDEFLQLVHTHVWRLKSFFDGSVSIGLLTLWAKDVA